MEWLILVVVVPLVLVPLILLFGFAGCGLDAVGTAPLAVAKNLTAQAVFDGNGNKVILNWIGSGAAKYTVRRWEPGKSPETLGEPTVPTFTDSPSPPNPLKEGTTYIYQVTAVTFANTPGGSSNEACTTVLPAAPSNLTSRPLTTTKITLGWVKNSTTGMVRIERRTPVQTDFQYYNETTFPTFEDGVPEGSSYAYRVFAVVEDGCDPSIPKAEVLSPPSNVVVGKPLAFATAFGAAAPEPNRHNHCLVQRIRVTGTGSKITMTIAGSGSPLRLDRIYISRVGAGGNPWDPDTQPTLVAQNVDVPPGGLTREVNYVISATPVDLLVAFDINFAAGQGNVRFVNIPGAESYLLNPNVPPQAGEPDRLPTFQTFPGRHYLVEKIQVS